MKSFPFVADQTLRELDGTEIKDETNKPVVWSHYGFLCARCADPTFGAPRVGLEQLRFAMATQSVLEEQRATADARGFWVLEDAPADALSKVTETPSQPYNLRFARANIAFADAVAAMQPYKVPAEDSPRANGKAEEKTA